MDREKGINEMILTKRLLKYSILIGCVLLISTWAFNFGNSKVLENVTINGVSLWRLNTTNYFDNLSKAWTSTSLSFDNIKPNKTWKSIGFFDFNGLFNNLCVIFDWIYFPINLLLWVIRWIVWIVRGLFAMLGLDIENGIMTIFTWVINNLMIPYI